MKQISWFTPAGLGDGTGYGYSAIETIRALQRQGIKVPWNEPSAGAHVNFIQPEFYGGQPYQYRIGYTPWESTEIPTMWPGYMQAMDEIWTTSQFCKDVFDAHKANDIVKVVPHGIDPEIFTIKERSIEDKFFFLHIGGGAERKGAKLVANAFMELFRDVENAWLIMKSNGPSEARWYDSKGNYQGNIASFPRCVSIENKISVDDIAKLYHLAHCCVYPTQGEGFGLIPFQAMATGLPTIVTNLTGCADYAELAMPLKATWEEGIGVHEGMWAAPDLDDLRELMLKAYNNWEEENKNAIRSAKIIHSTQTWDHVANQIINILGDRVDMKYEADEVINGNSR